MQFCLVNGGCVDLTGVGGKKRNSNTKEAQEEREDTGAPIYTRQIPSPLKCFAFREEVNKLPNAPLPRL